MTGGFDSIAASNGKFEGKAHLCADASCTYTLYDSQDGATWTQLASITIDFPPVVDVTFFHDDQIGYLAASSTNPGPGQGVGLWYSSDGISWTNVGDQSPFLSDPCGPSVPHDAGISEMYRAGSVVVAVGTVACGYQTSNVLWTSTDGKNWESGGQPSAHDVVTGHGAFVGSSFDGGVMFSSDGLSWSDAQGPGVPIFNCSIASVANGFVGVCPHTIDLRLDTSSDGQSWQQQPAPAALPEGPLSSDGTRAVTQGSAGVSVSSTDGMTWNLYPLPNDGGQLADAAAILGNRVLLWSSGVPRVWIGDLPAATPAVPTPSPQSSVGPSASPDMWTSVASDSLPYMTRGFDSINAINGKFEGTAHLCADGSCAYTLYDSADGTVWTPVASITMASFPPVVQMTFLHDDQIGYLAASSTNPGSGQGVGLWYSSDGTSWTNVGDQPSFLPPCAQSVPQDVGISQIYRAGSVLVAVGKVACTNQASEMQWTSVDGRNWESAGQTSANNVVPGHGVYVASTFLEAGGSGSESTGGIVFSSDGLSWTNAKSAPGTDQYAVGGDCSIASVASGFVGDCLRLFISDYLYGSPDGRTWQNLTTNAALPRGAVLSDGMRAVNSNTAGVSVSSTDGRKWRLYPLPNDDGQLVEAAAILGDRVVLWSYAVPRVWVADIPPATT